jgi:DNA-binding CsgD family transcriptional regulator/predicted SnoaL-like aldol condensation-catalyzing enzyme
MGLANMPNTTFTKQEAEQFVKELLEDVFPNGKVERLKDFYTPDVVGHYGDDEVFGFTDIEQRVLAIKQHSKNIRFVVQHMLQIDDLVLFSCSQNWSQKADNSFYDSLVFGVYRIQNKKIVELWIVLNTQTESYKDINKNFVQSMRAFEISQKAKREFFNRLDILQETGSNITLSKVDSECLYYYFHGFSAKETAQIMELSPRTVETYLANIKERLGCTTKGALRKKLFPSTK